MMSVSNRSNPIQQESGSQQKAMIYRLYYGHALEAHVSKS